jgi:Mn-dependent DtxR family transcriptional regulator
MAIAPSYDATKRAIFDAVRTYNVRADEIVPLMGIQRKLGPKFRAPEIEDALKKMIAGGLITHDGGRFIKLTDAGYDEM